MSKRIIFFTPSVRLLGARQSLLSLVEHLSPHISPLLVVPGQGELTDALVERDIPHTIIPHGAWRKLGGRMTAIFTQLPRLKKLVNIVKPDLIHCNEFHSTPQGIRTSLALNPRVPITSHVRLGITPRQIMTYEMDRVDRIAAVSQACKNEFAHTDLMDRVDVIYNGIDLTQFQPTDSPSALRKKFGWKSDDLVFGLLGLISPRKNQLIACEAVAKARKAGIPAKLLLAGDAFKSTVDYGEKVRARIQEEDLRGHVEWLQFQRNVRELYEAMDCNLLISSEEGFGRTIIEAGALNIPSIGAQVGGIPELIKENETGLLVPNEDSEALCQAMIQIAEQKELMQKLQENVRGHVTEHFSLDAYANGMMAMWEKAIEQASN